MPTLSSRARTSSRRVRKAARRAATRAGAASVQPVPASLMRAGSPPAPSTREGGMPVRGVRVLDGVGRVWSARARVARRLAQCPN